jgi:hypothetical protein
VKIGPLSKKRKTNNSSRDEICEKTARYSGTDHKTNTKIEKENITPVLNRIQECRRDWLQHINGMACSILSTIRKKQLTGRRTGKTIKETCRRVKPELVNKWPNSMLAR